MSDRNTNIIEECRTNEGRVGGVFEGAPILLLHTTGRRSGAERVNPLMYLADGDRWVVFASKGGHIRHPDWFRNLESTPEATILREGPERDDLFARQVSLWPQFGGYEEKTRGHRTIPVIVLERAD